MELSNSFKVVINDKSYIFHVGRSQFCSMSQIKWLEKIINEVGEGALMSLWMRGKPKSLGASADIAQTLLKVKGLI